MPKVSVIIPTYNRANLLEKAIQSVLNQTFRDFEIIVVDDGSMDNTQHLISMYQDKVCYIYQEHQGVSNARNTGILHANGDYLAFLDSDDLFLPRKLELQIEMLESRPEAGFVYGWVEFIDEHGNACVDPYMPTIEGDVLRELVKNDITRVGPSLAMIPRPVFDKVGLFDTQMTIGEDYDMWLRIAGAGYPFACVQAFLSQYRIHSGNTFKPEHQRQRRQTSLLALNKFFDNPALSADVLDLKPVAYGNYYLFSALGGYKAADAERAFADLKESQRQNPALFKDISQLGQTVAHFFLSNTENAADCEKYVDRVINDLTIMLPDVDVKPTLRSQLYGTLVFRYYQRRDFNKVRRFAAKAVLVDRRWLSERGFLSITVQSLLGHRLTKLLKGT